jgi:hypothetical protein
VKTCFACKDIITVVRFGFPSTLLLSHLFQFLSTLGLTTLRSRTTG